MLLCFVFWRISSTLTFCVLGLLPLCNTLFSFYGYKCFPSVFEDKFLGFFVLPLFSLLSHYLILFWQGGSHLFICEEEPIRRLGTGYGGAGWLSGVSFGTIGKNLDILLWNSQCQHVECCPIAFTLAAMGFLCSFSCLFVCFLRGRAHVTIIAVVFPVVVFIEVNTWL